MLCPLREYSQRECPCAYISQFSFHFPHTLFHLVTCLTLSLTTFHSSAISTGVPSFSCFIQLTLSASSTYLVFTHILLLHTIFSLHTFITIALQLNTKLTFTLPFQFSFTQCQYVKLLLHKHSINLLPFTLKCIACTHMQRPNLEGSWIHYFPFPLCALSFWGKVYRRRLSRILALTLLWTTGNTVVLFLWPLPQGIK